MNTVQDLATSLAVVAFGWTILVSMCQLTLVVSAMFELRQIRIRDRYQVWRSVLASPMAPKISVLVPAHNEELSVCQTVQGLLALSYQDLEIVVINDGSTDATVEVLASKYDLRPIHPVFQSVVGAAEVQSLFVSTKEPRLVVVDKLNGGKADSLNAGINIASGELVCAIDADTLVAPEALQILVAPFLDRDDVVAVGGTVRLVNDSPIQAARVSSLRVPKSFLAATQTVEYIRAFTVGRLGWNRLGGNLIISGAFGLFDRAAVLAAGGYASDSIGEDMELIVRLRRVGYECGNPARVEFLPDPVAWTEAPESTAVLARQRNRWQRGLLDVLVRHRAMLFRPKYRSAGLLSLPYFLVVELLAPILEALGLAVLFIGLLLGWYPPSTLWLVGTAAGLGAIVTLCTLFVDELATRSYPGVGQRLSLAAYAVLEQFLYRPLTLVWRLWGIQLFLMGRREWGQQVRRGFS